MPRIRRFALRLFLLAMALPCLAAITEKAGGAREVMPLEADWRFFKGDCPGAEQPAFVDAGWRALNLPHDWSIEGPFDRENPAGGAGAFLPAGIGWYRKHFSTEARWSGRRIFIEFDGVMANSDVWINGVHLGHRPNGYVSFRYDLTPQMHGSGALNLIAVRVDDSEQPASRWYAGAGIYRHVRLVITDPIHIQPWSTVVTASPAGARAVVRVRTTVVNQSDVTRQARLRITIIGPDGQEAQNAQASPQSIPAGGAVEFSRDLAIAKPRLWDIERPALYRAQLAVESGQTILDTEVTPFGIRDFKFDAQSGFWLNGRNFKLQGVCLHEDGSAFGMAVPLGVWERRLAALKELGVNAVRTAHSPPSPAFLDLCDRAGLLVMDEFFDCWTVGKNRSDYHLYFNDWSKRDAQDTLRRDRNHPSIILYSVGNEIHDTPKAALAKGILAGLVELCHQNDPTRPVTQALFRPNASGDYTNGLADLLDVIGTNYRDNELLAAHRANPARKILGTEQRPDRATWLACRDHPEHAGQFLWTGVDYLGESRRWPIVAAGSGLLDRCGQPRPAAFERQSWWSAKPMVLAARRVTREAASATDPGFAPLDRRQSLFADWTPALSPPHVETVEVYSNCEEVELLLNGQSLGSKPLPADASPRRWEVQFQPGELKAAGKNGGQVVAQYSLRTPGPAATIVLTADRAALTPAWDDVAFVRASVVDDRGVVVGACTNLITFNVAGPAVIAATDSADNASHEPFQASQRRAFQGICFALVKATASTGKITLSASATGLTSASQILSAAAPASGQGSVGD